MSCDAENSATSRLASITQPRLSIVGCAAASSSSAPATANWVSASQPRRLPGGGA
jgi:hypothetical protein